MKQTELFSKSQKQVPKDEVSLNAQLLIKGGFIDKLMAGVYTMMPLGFRVYKKIEQIIREEMNAVGGQEMYMPSMHPKSNWQQTGRWDDLDVLFKLNLSDGKEVALGPTHEEVVSPLAKKFINSYKDLPFAVYHIQNKFRNEKRAKSGILRGREFMMKDLYSFHADQNDLDAYYDKVLNSYINIFEKVGIGDVTYVTYASGGTFSKYSHEFQTLTDAGEDMIYICDNCRVAINKEILEDQKHKCPKCGSDKLREEKAVEVGNIFKLSTKFSEPFNLDYVDSNSEKKFVVMGCYGIGLQRLMGTVVEACNDERGIIWPESVAPFKYHLIEVKSDNKNVKEQAVSIYKKITEAGAEILYDDRDVSTGEKFGDADLIGCPLRIVVSDKTLKEESVEIKERKSSEVKLEKIDIFLQKIKK